MQHTNNPKVILCILDGWGEAPHTPNNAIAVAKFWPTLVAKFPHCSLDASQHAVGLPHGQMGNSEVGHAAIGTGRIQWQDLPKIDAAFKDHLIENNPNFLKMINSLKKSGKSCHLICLGSDGGVHAHINHLLLASQLVAASGIKVQIHLIYDGRDTAPKLATQFTNTILELIKTNPLINLATVGGRFYIMDRDQRWERTTLAYNAITCGSTIKTMSSPYEYNFFKTDNLLSKLETLPSDEFIKPLINENYEGMHDDDCLWMLNFRSDRVLQILDALLNPHFNKFERLKVIKFADALGMNDYSKHLKQYMASIFSKGNSELGLGEIISNQGFLQYRIAETEKFAHVTYFFNGGAEEPFAHETRILLASPAVRTYDLAPEMNADGVMQVTLQALSNPNAKFIVVNFANTDMVGHTGVVEAIKLAVIKVDQCLAEISACALKLGWTLIITADHGNAEHMYCTSENPSDNSSSNASSNPHTSHTLNQVPLVIVSNAHYELKQGGTLADIAPTILEIFNIEKPPVMTGNSLIINH